MYKAYRLKRGLTGSCAAMLGLNLLLTGGCRPQTNPTAATQKTEAAAEFKTTHLQTGAITRTITLPGEVKAFQEATLYAKVTGYLKTISVDKGDAVTEGQSLAEIEVPELLADQAKYRAESEVAQIDFKRVNDAQKKAPDLVVSQSVDTAKAKYEVANANLQHAQTLLGFTRIVAPFSGIITRRMVDAGAFIPAATTGNPQSAAILTLSDFNTVRVQIAIPEAEASKISKDQGIKVSVDGLPGQTFEGKISRYSYALDEASKTMLAESKLANPSLTLRPGMYATVQIGIERRENTQLLPADALVMEKANAFVFLLKDGKANKTPIKTGFNDGSNFEVLSGVSPGDAAILIGKRTLSDGQPVKAMEVK
jgi:membrane fusion protein (multidrug efflux system)